MIEILDGFPGNVIGCAAKGQVTATDYEDVLIPAIETALKAHSKIRCYYELGPKYTGMDPSAMWQDFKVGMEQLTHWERIAVVTDVPWIATTVNTMRFLIPCPTRVYSMDERSEARTWIASDR